MRLRKFLLFDALGSLLWAGTYPGVGYIFSNQIERIAEQAESLGRGLFVLLFAGLAAYILYTNFCPGRNSCVIFASPGSASRI